MKNGFDNLQIPECFPNKVRIAAVRTLRVNHPPPPKGFALKDGGTPLPTQHLPYNSSQRHAPDPNITPNRFSNRQ